MRLAAILGADPAQVLGYVQELLQHVPDALAAVIDAVANDGLDAAVLERLRADILTNIERCKLLLR